ncbi:DUF2461 family protein [Streptomyces pseudovenezuelae]|uniref:Uncharacterized protein (DUF2461 family) n=1 Tax=Streptomyces pseudovenezuelae TaxID=67350 RepID=A0ABT6LSB3_9ACTN|nr:DUF2461 family protein [Streptomyces pseudovenezuelae]MDH6219147.1 uncharacterized protein (DUF2461 family) [Streptomyces pseudovenezuelae]
MAGRFTGWPEGAFDVLLQLEGEPSQSVREKCRKEREQLVRQPMIALLNDLADRDAAYDDFSVWHYRTNSWWWQHQGAVIRLARNIEIGLRFDLDGLRIQGAWWYPVPEQIRKFRQAVAVDGSGRELTAIVEELRNREYEVTGDLMKRVPRDYPADHQRAELLRHRSLIAVRPLGCDGWLHTLEAVDVVLDAVGDLSEMMSWLVRHVKV